MLSVICFNLDQSKILLSGNGLMIALVHIKVPVAPNYKGVCLQNTSKPHSYHLKIW